MGFSIENIRLLALTARKADIEYNISINSMEKMAIAREQSDLTKKYSSMLRAKNVAYYANGKYNQMDYGYLMGYSCNTLHIMNNNSNLLKSDNSMILTDAAGLVVLGSSYVSTMTKVLGASCMDGKGRGGTFSSEKIPELIASITISPLEDIKKVMNGEKADYEYTSDVYQTTTNEEKGTTTTDGSDALTEMYQKLIDFYKPIFQAAAANGWTTEYNNEMEHNSNYVNDAIVSGTFQLAQVDEIGEYEPDTPLSYFLMSGLVCDKTDSSIREEVTAWYNEEKARINEKENWIDLEQQDLSTELEATKTEIESLKSMLEDDMKPFEWST